MEDYPDLRWLLETPKNEDGLDPARFKRPGCRTTDYNTQKELRDEEILEFFQLGGIGGILFGHAALPQHDWIRGTILDMLHQQKNKPIMSRSEETLIINRLTSLRAKYPNSFLPPGVSTDPPIMPSRCDCPVKRKCPK